MKRVQFTRDMRPQAAGSERILPDEVAARLESEGAVTILGDYPPRTQSGVPVVPAKPQQPRLSLPGGRKQSYQTK